MNSIYIFIERDTVKNRFNTINFVNSNFYIIMVPRKTKSLLFSNEISTRGPCFLQFGDRRAEPPLQALFYTSAYSVESVPTLGVE